MKSSTIIALVAGVAILGGAAYFFVFKKDASRPAFTPPLSVPKQVNLNSVNATLGGVVGQLSAIGLGKLEDKIGSWF